MWHYHQIVPMFSSHQHLRSCGQVISWPYLAHLRHLQSLTKKTIVILFMICISRQLCRFWMNFSMCLPGKSYLFSLQTFKEIEWKINPFTFADLSLSFCPWPRCSQTSWSVFRGSGTAPSTPSPMVRIMWERWGCCNDVNSLVWELGCCWCKVSLVRSSQGSGLITTFTVDIEDWCHY